MSGQDEFLIGAYERQVHRIAEGLRRAADEVERQAKVSDRITAPYLSGATNVLAAVQNMVPNLPLQRLVECAHECETLIGVDLGGES